MPDRFLVSEIQVSGLRTFRSQEWRNAIVYYLTGVWGNKDEVVARPKINFGASCLRLFEDEERYTAYGNPTSGAPFPLFCTSETLKVHDEQEEVNVGLMKFVHDDYIRQLVITLRSGGQIYLWKGQSRGFLYCAPLGLQSFEGFLEEFRKQYA